MSFLQDAGKKSLLTLPKTDLKDNLGPSSSSSLLSSSSSLLSSSLAATASSSPNDDRRKEDDAFVTPPLMLIQLPAGWSAKDLDQAYFVANKPCQQAALVVESKKTSFDLYRVETSNVLVMVPPPGSEETTSSFSLPPSKRTKTLDGKKAQSSYSLEPVGARLLKKGGSGASFLELRSKPLQAQSLLKELQPHEWDPYNNSNSRCEGKTLKQLANDLQLTRHQVRHGLIRMGAIALPDSDPPAYALLSEEAQQEAYGAILSTLAEVEEFSDYAVEGVEPARLIAHSARGLAEENRYVDVEHVLGHCLGMLSISHRDREQNLLEDKKRIRLDVCKVAARVVSRLFHQQTTPWEDTLLMSRWQSALPGVGRSYEVSKAMLRGIAVDYVSPANDKEGGERFWRYLPAESLSTEPAERFQALFAAKKTWYLDDLDPYLETLVMDDAASSQQKAELLLGYTKVVTQKCHGVTIKLYTRR